jgi:hypothetical protein
MGINFGGTNVVRDTGWTLRPKQRICLQIFSQKHARNFFGYSVISMNALFIEIVLCILKGCMTNKMQENFHFWKIYGPKKIYKSKKKLIVEII